MSRIPLLKTVKVIVSSSSVKMSLLGEFLISIQRSFPYTWHRWPRRYRLLVLLCEGQACACSVFPQNLRERTLNFHFAAAAAAAAGERLLLPRYAVTCFFLVLRSIDISCTCTSFFPNAGHDASADLALWNMFILYNIIYFLFFFFAGGWLKTQYIFIIWALVRKNI